MSGSVGRYLVRAAAIAGSLLCSSVPAMELAALPDAAKVEFRRGVRIPLRDGVRLSATAYIPKGLTTPAPCIFTLTPYISQTYHDRGVYFAARGLPFLTVDARGRGNSEGEFRPFLQEADDGSDIVAWLASQPYCNGKVATWGGSYAGYDQWAMAKERPPALATIVPVAAVYPGLDFPMNNNIAFPYSLRWLTLTGGRASQQMVFADRPFWAALKRQWFEAGRPLSQFDRLLGDPSPIFQEWLRHPHPDAYWDAHVPTVEQYRAMTVPILTITGSYDSDQPGALRFYDLHMKHATPPARASHYLIIGPWDHAGTRTPTQSFGGLTFADASLVDLQRLHLQWYAWTMQGGPKPEFLQAPVAYYVMGAERWRYAPTLAAVTARMQLLYLDSAGDATDVLASGSLQHESPGRGKPDSYVYDPRDISSAQIESVETGIGELVDQRLVYANKGKHLVYHSDPFEMATEISGFFKFDAWLAIDQPDTDFLVSVSEIEANGNRVHLSDARLRARYRENPRQPRLIESRAPLRYDFDNFTFVSRQVKRGSRLRLLLSPINSMYSQKNYNSGGLVAEESMRDARPVTVTLYHDRHRPSALHVPLGSP